MRNKGFTLIEIMVVAGISLGIAVLIFGIFILMNTGLSKDSTYSSLKQQSQIAMQHIQRYLEKSSPDNITIEDCQDDCRGDKITFQVPVVTTDAISGTAFDALGNLKWGAFYTDTGGYRTMVRDGYFDLYVPMDDNTLVLDTWKWRQTNYPGGPSCFLPGTPILMTDGSTKPIEEEV